MGTDLVPQKRSARGSRSKLTEERKRILTEMAAAAFVRMKHGDYKYPEGARDGRLQEDGSRINKRELMRIAGYQVNTTNTHYDRLEDDEYYQQMCLLYEKRYADPLWRDDQISAVWETVGNEALRNVYEKLINYPHELTVEQLLKIIKTVIDSGVALQKIGKVEGKGAALIKSVKDPAYREELRADYRRKLEKELEELDGEEV